MNLDFVKTGRIKENPANPRGINISEDDPKQGILRDSIKQFGILVPIVVKPQNGNYLLVDGERRLVAARALGMEEVPAYILKEELSANDIMFRMFQIHHTHERWGPIQQCSALESVYVEILEMDEVKKIHDHRAKVKRIADKLEEATGIDPVTARDRVHFFRWPTERKQKCYKDPVAGYYLYICEIEDKIIIPALQNYPEYFKKVPADEVREALFEKLLHHTVVSGIEPRRVGPIVKSNITKKSDRKKVLKILEDLRDNRDMTYDEANEAFYASFPELEKGPSCSPRSIVTAMNKLYAILQDFDVRKLGKYKQRSKASKKELQKTASALRQALDEFTESLG